MNAPKKKSTGIFPNESKEVYSFYIVYCILDSCCERQDGKQSTFDRRVRHASVCGLFILFSNE
jgi:hypothetical protein